MYGGISSMTPEVFPTKARGTGNALTYTSTRLFGVIVSFRSLKLLD
jgi:hypothetical protein